MQVYRKTFVLAVALFGVAWAVLPLDSLSKPWGGVLGEFLALPYWVFTYLPQELLGLASLAFGFTLPLSALPPPISVTVGTESLVASLLTSALLTTAAAFLYGSLVLSLKRFARLGSIPKGPILAIVCLSFGITYVQWISGFAADLFGNSALGRLVVLGATVCTYVQARILDVFGIVVPEVVIYSGHIDWRTFVESSCQLTFLSAILLFMGFWLGREVAHRIRSGFLDSTETSRKLAH